jgi:hypothetical protein
MHGCYVDTRNPFPVQSKVKVTITHNEESFVALGTVAHAEPNIGMGISFSEVEPNQTEILLKWLAASGSGTKWWSECWNCEELPEGPRVWPS